MTADDKTGAAWEDLTPVQREQAMTRYAALQPHLDDGAPLTQAAYAAEISLQTAQR